MLRNLFRRKPRLDHADPAVRLAALAARPDDDQDTFEAAFREDLDRDVRLAALARLDRPEAMADALDDPDMREHAARRILGMPGDIPPALREHAYLAGMELAGARDAAVAVAAAGRLGDSDAVVGSLLANPSAHIRVAVAQTVWRPETLLAIERATRGRDKTLYRLVHERLAERRTALAARGEQDRLGARLHESAAQIADDDPHYDAKRDAVEREWSDLEAERSATDERLARFGDASSAAARAAALPPRRPEPEPPSEPEPEAGASAGEGTPVDEGASGEAAASAGDAAQPDAAAGDERADTLESLRELVHRADALAADPGPEAAAALRQELSELLPETSPRDDPAPGDAGAGDALPPVNLASFELGWEDEDADPDPADAAAEEAADRDGDESDDSGNGETEARERELRRLTARAVERIEALERAVALAPESAKALDGDLQPVAEDQAWDEAARRLQGAQERRRALRALRRNYGWPRSMPRPAALEALAPALERAEAVIDSGRRRLQALEEVVAGRLSEFESAVDGGIVHDAEEHERTARDLVAFLPREAAREPQQRLGNLSARLRDLRGWRTFAEAPKREALCERMEALAEEPLEAPVQADEVRSLRAQWNELGPVASRRDRNLLGRFDSAAEKAFEPCRAHFAAQAERRSFNLEQRRAIVEVLEDYVDNRRWEGGDWFGVERVLRTARSEWRSYYPVDRRGGRDVEARFNELTGAVHDVLKGQWDANTERLEGIIAEAASVRQSDDHVGDRIESLKRLQQRWKDTGPVPRRVSQRLWRRFRDECDPVFEERETRREERAEHFRQVADDVDAVLAELKGLAGDDALDRAALTAVRERVAALTPLPRRMQRSVDNALSAAARSLARREAEGERQAELDWLSRLEELDRAFEPAARTDGLDAWRESAGDLAEMFAERLDGDGEEAEDPHQLTVAAEIEAEAPSPEADQNLRLALQIERINGDLGGVAKGAAGGRGAAGGKAAATDCRSLARRWCSAPSAGDEELRRRFFAALRTLVDSGGRR